MLQLKINGQSIFVGVDAPANTPSGVSIEHKPEGSPPFLPFIDTLQLPKESGDGQASCYWRRSPAEDEDSLQVFYSLDSAHGPWLSAGYAEELGTEVNKTLLINYEEIPSPGANIWLFVRGTRENGDVAYSPVVAAQIET